MISYRPTRAPKLGGLAIIILLLVSLFTASAYAYNDRPGHTHSWLARKSLARLKERRPDIASKFPLDYYLVFMEEGIRYADNTTDLVCNWARAVTALDPSNWGKSGDPAVSYPCDALHHYGKLEAIETEKGIDAGHPGAFTGQDYVPALFDTAVAFWPGNDKPVLSQLIKKDAGYITSWHNGDFWLISPYRPAYYWEGDNQLPFGNTYLGGAPYCDFVFNSKNCPRWPSWAASDTAGKLAIESRENSAKYLGWAMHIIQDLTVPYHANNDATPDHQKYEGNVDQQVLNNEFEHLSTISDFYKGFNPKQLADEAFSVGIRGTIGTGYGTIDSRLDTAIKLGATLMERFFDRVEPQEQRYSNIVHKFSGKYVVTGATNDGGEIHLWGPIPKGHEDRYSFLLIPTYSGNYYLVHKYSGKYVYAGSKNGEQLVLQRSYIPGGQEGHYEFKLIPTGDGYYYLMNTQSEKYVVTGATNDGGKIHLWNPIPKGHEDRYKFLLEPPPSQPSKAVLHLLGLKCDEPATSFGDEIKIRVNAKEWEKSFNIDQGQASDLSSTKLEFQKREFVEFIEEGDPAAIIEITDAVADLGPQSVAINIKGDGRYTLYYEVLKLPEQPNQLSDADKKTENKKTELRLISLRCEEPATSFGDDIDIFINGDYINSHGQISIDEDKTVPLETKYKFHKNAIIEFNEDSDPAGRVVIDDSRANLGKQSTSVRVKDDGVYTLEYEVYTCNNC